MLSTDERRELCKNALKQVSAQLYETQLNIRMMSAQELTDKEAVLRVLNAKRSNLERATAELELELAEIGG